VQVRVEREVPRIAQARRQARLPHVPLDVPTGPGRRRVHLAEGRMRHQQLNR
jgi:hypothetical protein